MACRFPGAGNLQQFWRNLCDGVESMQFFSEEEVLAAGIDPKLVHRPQLRQGLGRAAGHRVV